LPIVFAVVDNGQYLILKSAMRTRDDASARTGTFIGLELDQPRVDFVGLARSMGVEATLVEKPHEVGDAVRGALAAGRPHLLHLPIAG
jgi:benzoylformate decarboxylase